MVKIKTRGLSKNYDNKNILDDLNLELDKGEVLGIKGENGSGKTTLLNCIAGIEEYNGELTVQGDVSYLFQDSRLLPWMNVRKNILMPLKLKGESIGEEEIERMRSLSGKLDVEQHLEKSIKDVSGGQKQRILQARALITDPNILLLDEPFRSLDPDNRKNAYKRLLEICRSSDKSVIITSHQKDIHKLTDRTIKL